MLIISDVKGRVKIVCDHTKNVEQRVFALLESVFLPVSFLSLAALVVVAVLRGVGVEVAWFRGWWTTILISAAIGYITNWIAIEMLFKPYQRTMRHPFAWITCGIWRQGLVPKNKGEIARVLGEQVATKLLQPEKIADDLCSMIGSVLRNERVVVSIRNGVQRLITSHDKEIAAFLAPRIEQALVAEIDRLVTVEKVEEFWTAHLEPKLQSAETRDEIASLVIAAIEKRVPALAAKVKPRIAATIADYVANHVPLIGGVVGGLAAGVADLLVSREMLENGIRKWLRSPETVPALRDELLTFVQSARDYLKSDSTRAKMGSFVEEIRGSFKEYVRSYVETNLASISERILNSETLWNKIVEMIPEVQPEIEQLVRTEGLPLILEKLDIQGRIETTVDKMDVAEFHGMINEIAAQHLGAIQVLGYLLGAVAGALTLLI